MKYFRSLSVGEISLIASENNDKLLVIIETTDEPQAFDTDPEAPGPADVFDNLYSKWNASLDVGGVDLAVISYNNRFARENSADNVLIKIEKDVKRLSEKMGVDSDKVGILICSAEISRLCFKDGLDFINVLVANKSDKRPKKAFPLRLPFDSEFSWTNTVPAWLWYRSGSIKDDGEGINLLGFVVRAAAVVLYKQTEMSIYSKMRAYHRGKYGVLKIVQNMKHFNTMMDDLESKKYIGIDTETDNLNRIENTMLAIQFAAMSSKTDIPTMWVLPCEHSETPWTTESLKVIKRRLRTFFERKCKKQIHVYANAKFDIHQFMSFLKLRWYAARIYDVMAGSFSLEENQKFMKPLQVKPYSLEHMERRAEYERPPELVIKKSDRDKMATFTIQQIADYGIIDVLTPLYLMFEQIEVAKNRGYPRFLTFITRQMGPMIYIMTEMEHNGISIDMEYLKQIASPIGPLAERIRQTANELAQMATGQQANKMLLDKSSFQKNGLFGKAVEPQVWNIRDAKHLQLLFFEILGLQPLSYKKGKEGEDMAGSLNKKFKNVYRHTPEVKVYTTYEKLQKLKSAFATAIYKYMINDPDMRIDQRLRPIFGFLGVLTGRSCFTAETPIYVLDDREKVAIKDIKAGDWVWTVNEQTMLPEPKRVVKAWQVGKRKTVKVVYTMRGWKDHPAQTKTLVCTPDHPFLLTNGEWVEAKDFLGGESVYALDSNREHIQGNIERVDFESEDYVYDIQVEDNNNFFANGLCAHNSTFKPSTQQIPTHGPDAKSIKKQFKVKKRRIMLKSDYAAHEVRVSGNLSHDPAICGAVDLVDKAFMRYRLAVTPEEVAEARANLVDLHCQNFFTFYGIEIDKKDPRRQDAKVAVFAVTYGSMAKSIGEGMLTTALVTLEDKLVKHNKVANDNKHADWIKPEEVKKMQKQIRYLRTEDAQKEYHQRAKDLLEVLYDKWGVLTKFIDKEQAKAQVNNVVFGPHGRPRHLWGYLHFDKFIHFAMNRRVFNSEGQGYASDYGYTGIYLAKKAKWDLFESRGIKFDSLQTNAVHDSSFNELSFKLLPIAVYLQEHSMISLTEKYYSEYFGIKSKSQYGFEMEIGLSEDNLTTWNGRYDDSEGGLLNIIRKCGKETGYSDAEIEQVVKDAKIIGRLRMEELHSKNVWHTSLYDKHIYDRIVPRLKCFKPELWNDHKATKSNSGVNDNKKIKSKIKRAV